MRWVQDNIRHFGGNPGKVTIAGQSAGGLSVLAQMVSPGARGLFAKAIIQSGSFALNQQPLASAEAAGETFAAQAGCPDQTAACLRSLLVSALVSPNNYVVMARSSSTSATASEPYDRENRPGAQLTSHRLGAGRTLATA